MNYRPAKIYLQREKGGRAGDMVQFLKCMRPKFRSQYAQKVRTAACMALERRGRGEMPWNLLVTGSSQISEI